MFVVRGCRSSSVSGDDDVNCQLVIASSADYASNACAFSGPDVSDGKDCEIPGLSPLFVTFSFTSVILSTFLIM